MTLSRIKFGKKEVLTVDPEIVKQLEALGVGAEAIPDSSAERVYRALVNHWRKEKCPPTKSEIMADSGLRRTAVTDAYAELVTAGRIIRARPGVYVPKVTK